MANILSDKPEKVNSEKNTAALKNSGYINSTFTDISALGGYRANIEAVIYSPRHADILIKEPALLRLICGG